jgi:hypothetical protein
MSESALKIVNEEIESTDISKISSFELINRTHTPELIFALCGFMGTEIHPIADRLKFIMENDYGYACRTIRLSELIQKNKFSDDLKTLPKNSTQLYTKTKNLIHHGNQLREKYGESVLADLAIHLIGEERVKEAQASQEKNSGQKMLFKPRKVCFIIDSIKNPNELDILRSVYRRLLYCIGIFSPTQIREDNLKNKQLSPVEITDTR